jgi:hypothetical protein
MRFISTVAITGEFKSRQKRKAHIDNADIWSCGMDGFK